MTRRCTLLVVAATLAVTLPLLSMSCAKKTVQTEGVFTPRETQPVEEPTPEVTTRPPSTRPSEETLTEGEAIREEETAFVNEDIHFDYDKYDLKPRAREILAEKAFFLKSHPNVKILIEGHCDERGTNEYNLALGERRANSAKQYLVNLGISADRIHTISYGEERPLDPRENEDAWAKNRRAHFVITSR